MAYKDPEMNKIWRKKNKEYIKEKAKKYREVNKELIKRKLKAWHRKNPKWKNEYNRKYYQDNRERIDKQHQEWYRKNPEFERERYKKYYQNNLEKERERCRKYKKKNREKIRESWREWYKNKENREKYLEWHRQYSRSHPELEVKRRRKWRKENPKKNEVLYTRQNYRRRQKFPIDIDEDTEKKLIKRDGLDCIYCVRPISELYPQSHPLKFTKDHIDEDGGSVFNNLAVCCKSCNSSKRAKDVFLWAKQKFPDDYNRIVNKVESIRSFPA